MVPSVVQCLGTKPENQDVLIEDDYKQTIRAGEKSYDGIYFWKETPTLVKKL